MDVPRRCVGGRISLVDRFPPPNAYHLEVIDETLPTPVTFGDRFGVVYVVPTLVNAVHNVRIGALDLVGWTNVAADPRF